MSFIRDSMFLARSKDEVHEKGKGKIRDTC